jgi:hypothetical protein
MEKESLVLKLATNPMEYEKSFTLAHDIYTRIGVMEKNESRMRVSIYNMLPTTKLLVLKKNEEILSSITIIEDSEFGLPSDEIFSAELKLLRTGNKKLFEASCFVSSDSLKKNNSKYALEICRKTIEYCAQNQADYLIMGANPEYKKFYERILGFEFITEERCYSKVNNFPSILGILPKNKFNSATKKSAQNKAESIKYLTNSKLAENEFLKMFGEKSNILYTLNEKEKQTVANYYPEYKTFRILNNNEKIA